MRIPLIQDKSKLRVAIENSNLTQDQIDSISEQLKKATDQWHGNGMAAPQLGISERIVFINVIDPLILVNPRITETSNTRTAYIESCLSLPKTMKTPVKTIRFTNITIECDNLGTVKFGTDVPFDSYRNSTELFSDMELLECVVAQHEIDHLDGILITDSIRRFDQPIKINKKYGRNEMVMVKSPTGETEFLKYKKAEALLATGYKIV